MKRMTRKQFEVLLSISILWLGTILPSAADAAGESPAEFYKGKTVEFIIPLGVGGGTDRLSRTLIPYLEKYLGASIVPFNRTGAAGLVGMNHMWDAKPNGLVMGMAMMDTAGWSEFVGNKAVRFKTSEFTLIGGVESMKMLVGARKDIPYKTFDQLVNAPKQVLFGCPGKMSTMHIMMVLLSDAFDFDIKVIAGYKGGAGQLKAVEGGEVDIVCLSDFVIARGIREGKVIPLVYVTPERQKLFPDVPAVTEFKSKKPEVFDRLLSAMWLFEHVRAVVMPPGVSEEKANFVRAALSKALKEADLIKKGEKAGIEYKFTPFGQYAPMMKKLFVDISPQEKERIKKLLQ